MTYEGARDGTVSRCPRRERSLLALAGRCGATRLDIPPPQHLLQALARETEPLGRARLRPALAERVLDHAPLEMLDRVVERRRCPRGRPIDPDPLGQMLGRDRLAWVGERDGSLDLVLELADVAGKRVRAQARHRLGRD